MHVVPADENRKYAELFQVSVGGNVKSSSLALVQLGLRLGTQNSSANVKHGHYFHSGKPAPPKFDQCISPSKCCCITYVGIVYVDFAIVRDAFRAS
ncbi:hypothetical protein AG1IA_02365 [Rhizoctonia solani AG-1 IA]|uniref:Uncharacterized protein n=1 Tax=Thanatephorus cucumeris (strain AG1-IA) TaxID=983506 RepID=L8X3I6_THACA|nr:hypothetical protein AG1IA_02365 [Rhizoctonia solani AG-1 IA]